MSPSQMSSATPPSQATYDTPSPASSENYESQFPLDDADYNGDIVDTDSALENVLGAGLNYDPARDSSDCYDTASECRSVGTHEYSLTISKLSLDVRLMPFMAGVDCDDTSYDPVNRFMLGGMEYHGVRKSWLVKHLSAQYYSSLSDLLPRTWPVDFCEKTPILELDALFPDMLVYNRFYSVTVTFRNLHVSIRSVGHRDYLYSVMPSIVISI